MGRAGALLGDEAKTLGYWILVMCQAWYWVLDSLFALHHLILMKTRWGGSSGHIL